MTTTHDADPQGAIDEKNAVSADHVAVVDRLVDTFDSMCPYWREEIWKRIVAALAADQTDAG